MAHRTIVDLLLGRHYCPACGRSSGFRKDFKRDKAKVHWYQLAPVRLFCNACGVEVRGTVGSGVWVVPLWAVFGGAIIVWLYDSGHVGRGGAELLLLPYLVAGLCIFQYFLRYEVTGNAP